MKDSLKFLLLITLFISISCHSQYYLTDPEYSIDGTKFSGILYFKGSFDPSNYNINWTSDNVQELLTPIEKLNIQISLECEEYLHIKVVDALNKRWEPDFTISDTYKEKIKTCSQTKTLKDFGLYISEEMTEPFYMSLTNPETGELIFTTENADFLYSDLLIGFGGYITTNDIYGFGERSHELKLGDGKFTMWPNDTNGLHEDLGIGGYNAMGIHPLGFHRTSKAAFVGLLFNNINAQDLIIESGEQKSYNNNNVLLEHLTIGGVIDYFITLNNNPEQALISLHEIIGHPTMPPFWSLGFHQCRWGYYSDKDIRNIYENYIAYELPIDTFWGDIDILQDYRIFTLNKDAFSDLPNLIHEMHEKNYKFVPIVDIGFPMKEEDEFYMMGKETNAFIKSNYTKEDLVSHVWPGRAVFPDFYQESAVDLWKYAMKKYYETVKYDGIWLDMNEPAMTNYQDVMRGEFLPEGQDFDPKYNKYEYLPYIPGYRPDHPTIRSKTLSENCYSNKISENEFLYGYNFKPAMNYIENRITNEGLISLNKRPFIISRSTTLSLGRYAFHWLGDNTADYWHMRNGLNGIFQFQIYGIPMTGDDICGFFNPSWDKLCARWMSMGSFYPFSRNHNHLGFPSQEPYAFGRDSFTYASSKLALNMKYSLLRYYYTSLFKVSLGEKGSFFKPLFFEYFSDEKTTVDMAESFMVGDAFIVFPVFKNETDDIEVYMPKDDWSKFPSGEIYRSKNDGNGKKIKLSGEFGLIHIFMRGGQIFPFQNTFNKFIANTKALSKEKTELYIIPDSETHIASGDLIFDNDEYDTLSTGNYYYIHVDFNYNVINFNVNNEMKYSYENKDIYVSKFKFFRMKYLIDSEKNDIARIEFKNGRVAHILINYLSDDTFEVDLSNTNARFYEINKVKFVKNN